MITINLIFEKLHLHNFASHRDSIIDLNDMGFTLVVGRNNCKLDNAYSNGSGKSAIFNGLCFALTGETTQGISSGIENIFTNPDDCWVKLTFQVDGQEFVIQRIKTPKQNLKIFIDGEDKSGKGIRESSLLLAEYIPDLTPELLSSIIILGQGMPHRFTNNKPSHRKELLESLTKSDFMIQSIKDSLESRQTDLRLQLREKEDSLIANKSQLSVYENQYQKLEQELDEYAKLSSRNIDESITTAQNNLKQLEIEIQTQTDNLQNYNSQLEECIQNKSDLISERANKIQSETSSLKSKIQEKTSKVYEITAELKALTKEIKTLEAITDICPTCGQKIPHVNKPSTDEQYKSKAKLEKSQSKLNKEIEDLEIQISDINKNTLEQYSERIEENQLNQVKIKENISSSQAMLKDLREDQSEYTKTLYSLNNLKENYNKLVDDSKLAQEQINSISKTIQDINLDITNINSHSEVVQQMITLAKREFRGILLSNVITFIDKKVKQYSKEVFGTDKLAFTLNDNYIDITYCDKLYENLSGGEKQKIDIIIQLALRDILSKQLNIHSNLLVLDEIYDNADAISCQKITNLISTLTDIDSIFIISHHVQDLGLTYDNQLLVEKNQEGISSVTFS